MVTRDEDEFYGDLGQRLRELRKHQDLTQQDLANATGLSRGSIANIERGAQAPGVYTVHLLASLLQVPTADLITGDYDVVNVPPVDPVGRAWGDLVTATIRLTEAMGEFQERIEAYSTAKRGR